MTRSLTWNERFKNAFGTKRHDANGWTLGLPPATSVTCTTTCVGLKIVTNHIHDVRFESSPKDAELLSEQQQRIQNAIKFALVRLRLGHGSYALPVRARLMFVRMVS